MNKNAGAGRRTGNHKLENKGVYNSLNETQFEIVVCRNIINERGIDRRLQPKKDRVRPEWRSWPYWRPLHYRRDCKRLG